MCVCSFVCVCVWVYVSGRVGGWGGGWGGSSPVPLQRVLSMRFAGSGFDSCLHGPHTKDHPPRTPWGLVPPPLVPLRTPPPPPTGGRRRGAGALGEEADVNEGAPRPQAAAQSPRARRTNGGLGGGGRGPGVLADAFFFSGPEPPLPQGGGVGRGWGILLDQRWNSGRGFQ